MKAIRVLPQQQPVVFETDGSLEQLQKEVGGYIELVRLDAKTDAVVNDEGLLTGLPSHRKVGPHDLVGPIVVLSHDDEGDSAGLTDAQIEQWTAFFSVAA